MPSLSESNLDLKRGCFDHGFPPKPEISGLLSKKLEPARKPPTPELAPPLTSLQHRKRQELLLGYLPSGQVTQVTLKEFIPFCESDSAALLCPWQITPCTPSTRCLLHGMAMRFSDRATWPASTDAPSPRNDFAAPRLTD